ncbi:MAG: DUF2059 domain-containing protein [Rhodospirillaceae bacterium]|jgi:hypothetical protein|nr:DUF2059 domain-containing protein [Rhodospirillales bacterium]MBT3904445.1 DUF2059 domain-containing protein [Rhodospirillaceae bacterium]MBT4701189.1 DUF2059 domain-containing protein [Rhodospirillaceae bacterium]MBT5034193.1 DUF2059 domain-containing protein [Rhodospirillaceae bacterium]MBT6219995.1 DUF2059 domain-containing protein [Rhodospirillaceae bacterium]
MIKTRILLGLCMMLALAAVQSGSVQADDTSKLKLAQEVGKVLHLERVMTQMADGVAAQINKRLKESNKEVAPDVYKEVQDRVREHYSILIPNMSKISEEAIGRLYTEEDLKILLAFYKTEAGQKTLSLMPRIMREVMTWATPRSRHMAQQVYSMLKDQLGKKGFKL